MYEQDKRKINEIIDKSINPRKNINRLINFSTDVYEDVDVLSKKMVVTKSETIRRIIDIGLSIFKEVYRQKELEQQQLTLKNQMLKITEDYLYQNKKVDDKELIQRFKMVMSGIPYKKKIEYIEFLKTLIEEQELENNQEKDMI